MFRPYIQLLIFTCLICFINSFILSSNTNAQVVSSVPNAGWVIFDRRDGNDDIYYIPGNSDLVKISCQEIYVSSILPAFRNGNDKEAQLISPEGETKIEELINKIKNRKECSNSRWVSDTKDNSKNSITAIVIFRGGKHNEHNPPNVIFQESKRDSAFFIGLKGVLSTQSSLVKKNLLGAYVAPPTPPLIYYKESYILKNNKGVVNIEIEMEDEKEISAQVTTGTKDSVFFSADIPIDSLNDLQTFSSLNNYYYGLNYLLFGDAQAQNVPGISDLSDGRWGIAKIYAKAMVMNSDKPLNSLGIGMGYLDLGVESIPLIGPWLKTISPFLAGIYTINDSDNGTNRQKYSTELRFGLSVSINDVQKAVNKVSQ
jgi:hypothetical protein